ncbi:LysR family transcriptional regulator [Spongiactinospora rosea]|uniref:LysR family transcriptional regulator n=1 Tax=Spongiactinospora rosea TaxID=2248750 RepID=A0A366LNC9_9ACTN|nr:LysR family transcriptional regulator [Spongiactinospora rosea]RBQ14929.1 LysR family transcriptional regulator [Spongiactinospora rosea]
MTLDDLRVFIEVCERGSFTAVARALSCSQSAVSQHVRRLEREFGLSLLERRPRGVSPTAAGRLLRDAALTGVGRIDAAAQQLRALAAGGAGEVRISSGAATVRHFMPEAIVTLRRRYPGVQIALRTQPTSRACLTDLAANRADIALISISGPIPDVELRPLIELRWALAVNQHDPLASRASLSAAELADIPDIVLPTSSSSRGRLTAVLGESALPTQAVSDWDTALLLAELGVNRAVVATVPHFASSIHPGLRLVPIPDLPAPTAGWAARSWADLDPPVIEFAELVGQRMRGPG